MPQSYCGKLKPQNVSMVIISINEQLRIKNGDRQCTIKYLNDQLSVRF